MVILAYHIQVVSILRVAILRSMFTALPLDAI